MPVPPSPCPRTPTGARLLLVWLGGLALCATPADLGGWSVDALAQAQDSGLLRVTTSVPGATVYIDNQLAGDAPYTAALSPGAHTVRVTADNFDPFVRRVTIVSGSTIDLKADLLAGNGTVEFVVDAPGARLILNGKDEYPTPVRLRDLAPGTFGWRIEAPGHEPTEGSFEFRKGANLLFAPVLQSSAGRFEISSRPEGAEVFIDGQRRGQTPLSLQDVDPGIHQVLVDLRGHATVLRTIDTSDGSKGIVDVRLPESGAALTVKTNRRSAEVLLNGVRVGEGRKVRLPEIERGRYTLTVRDGASEAVETRIEVPEDGGAWWRARLDEDGSRLRETTPITRTWYFWTGAGVVASGAAVGGLVAYNASIPDPIPAGDIVVSLP